VIAVPTTSTVTLGRARVEDAEDFAAAGVKDVAHVAR
jgi:hypothetical protein